MKKNLVVKDNALINASYNLDLVEQRLILLAIVEARREKKQITENSIITIKSDIYISNFDVHRNTAYEALKTACNNLFDRRFSYQKLTEKGNIENIKSRWVQKVSYVENEALVRVQFSSDIIPFITKLESHFTSYELEQVSELKSAYAVRLYELLIAWRSTKKLSIKLKDLRYKLGVLENEYIRIDSFKSSILNLAIKQINEKTDLTVKYEQHKSGRVIVGFTFSFKEKPKVITKKEHEKNEKTKKNKELYTKQKNMPKGRKYKTTAEKLKDISWVNDDWVKQFE
jgi:plasmid replication initiation protein